jgi:hypothetical protein
MRICDYEDLTLQQVYGRSSTFKSMAPYIEQQSEYIDWCFFFTDGIRQP